MVVDKERKIVSWLLGDRSLWIQAAPFLEPRIFNDTEVKSVVGFVKKFVDDHKQLPTEDVIQIELGFKPSDKFGAHEPNAAEKSYIITELERVYKEAGLHQFLVDGVDMLQAGNVNYDKLMHRIQEIVRAQVHHDVGMNYFREALKRFDEATKPTFMVPTGFAEMDKRMGGGWERKEMYLVGGGTGAGKSIYLTNFASKNVLLGKHVLIITLELSEPIFGLRFDSIFLRKDRHTLINDKDRSIRLLQGIEDATNGSLYLKYYPTGSLNCNMIDGYLENYFIETGRYPDIIYIDYMSLMRPNAGLKDANTYITEKVISEEIRGLAGELDVPIISATQLNRGGMDSAIPDKSEIADSVGKLFTVGGLFNISQTKAEKALGLSKLYCAKGRNFGDGWMARFKLDYNTLALDQLDSIDQVGSAEAAKMSNEYEGIT